MTNHNSNSKKFEWTLSEQEFVRYVKHKQLVKEGKDSFQETKFERNYTLSDLHKKFGEKSKEQLLAMPEEKKFVRVAGRIYLLREAGQKAVFANIQDQDSSIQLYCRLDEMGEETLSYFRNLDLGDIVGVEGIVMRTDHGELSIRAKKYKLLTKAIRPLPDKHSGIQDIEEKYRRRYVDLIINPEVKKVFQARTKIIRTIQEYLDSLGYLEVETPILQNIRGGASAKPFKSYYKALDSDFYLRIATELHLKRLVVGGFEGVYEIGRIFRNEGMDTRHNPEFTSLELYVAYEDMNFLMNLTETIFRKANKAIGNPNVIPYGKYEIDLDKPFHRLHMVDGIKQHTGIDFWKPMTFAEAKKIAEDKGLKVESHFTGVGHIINLFFEEFVEKSIIEPTFVYGHPVEISPLSKLNKEDPRFTDRFELFIIGREYVNAFSELNNPEQQYNRFLDQENEGKSGNDEATEMDLDFIEALKIGLPPTAGIGIGIDRLVMLLTNSESIKDVLFFPQLLPRTIPIYSIIVERKKAGDELMTPYEVVHQYKRKQYDFYENEKNDANKYQPPARDRSLKKWNEIKNDLRRKYNKSIRKESIEAFDKGYAFEFFDDDEYLITLWYQKTKLSQY